ncbi:hypothetical protein [Hydrogenophaga sp. 5NK40-0174]|uniref:DUF6985 domain-containing protein n=1 Tax=Hydrogenophaga sp. 5NK40-0174 TaxID=3127649 RepID=UPI003105246A
MFGLFKPEPFADDALGSFKKSGSYWIGAVDLAPHGAMELRLAGDRKGPYASALALAQELPTRYASHINQIEAALYDHFLAVAEANARGDLGALEEPFPEISEAREVWQHVFPSHVAIEPLQGISTVEIAYRVGWDEEHTLGVRLQNWQFIELCGSV